MGAGAEAADVLVVGAGPAGSVAACVLARGGASVLLVDRAESGRDKACGDLVGPRGMAVLAELGLATPPGLAVGDMAVVGPTGRQVVLPSAPGLTYPGAGAIVPRTQFDASLRDAAIDAGARPVVGRARAPIFEGGRLRGFEVGDRRLVAGAVIGADGATSQVATCAGLVDEAAVLWGFALRSYVDTPDGAGPALPTIVWWEPEPWRPLPGYGWVFPSPSGRVNLGVGVGVLGDRRRGSTATAMVEGFSRYLRAAGLLAAPTTGRMLGGWLKLGMVGTQPASGRVLLVGDAAGLVNPLQGEGIAHAMTSGLSAARALLGEGDPAAQYTAALRARHLPFEAMSAAIHRGLLGHPWAVAATSRVLTAPVVGRALAGGWALLWNDLVDGAAPGPGRTLARAAQWTGAHLTARTATARWFGDAEGPIRGPVA